MSIGFFSPRLFRLDTGTVNSSMLFGALDGK